MAKKILKRYLSYILVGFIVLICLWGFIFHPEKIAQGVFKGLLLSGQKVIPSLFPFMVFSSCVSKTWVFHSLSKKIEKLTKKIFKVSGVGFSSILLGFLGGYPVGAKSVNDIYSRGLITKNEACRLFCWCSNPSPAFVISAVGVFMFSSYKSGIILYLSSVLSAFVIGFCTRFFEDGKNTDTTYPVFSQPKNIFTSSVSETSETILGICGWLLTFCSISALIEVMIPQKTAMTFINCISEVTFGCETASAEGLSLPIISAILGFGGFAVIFQILTYMKNCGLSLRVFICIKALNGALNAFFCSVLMRIFPESTTVSATIIAGNQIFSLSHSIITALFLIIMCTVFVLEVDNKRKMC